VVQFPIWAKEFSPPQSVCAGSGTNPASYAVGSVGLLLHGEADN